MIYAGSYVDTLTKAVTATKAGNGPQMAVLLAVDAYSLVDDDLILPFDTLAATADDKAWLAGFYPAFLRNGQIDGHLWGIPFQRSTIVLYYNKAAFQEAGLDPDKAPANWAGDAAFALKTTKRDGGRTTRWGVEIPGHRLRSCWLYRRWPRKLAWNWPTRTAPRSHFLNEPGCVEALQYWMDLATKDKSHPPGIVDWGTAPRDFLQGDVAMLWHTTGNLSNIRANAKFPLGVSMLPADMRSGSPTGGGNFHLFKGASPAQQAACLRLLKFLTSPERAAQWGIDTGYVATRPDAWQTDAMKAYVAGFPPPPLRATSLKRRSPELSNSTTTSA